MITALTLGHSTRSLEEFIQLLVAHRIERLVDVRTIPRSRTNPQYNRETFPGALNVVGIQYTHMPGLGGLRRPKVDSLNTGWRNLSFRGYADYMQSEEFQKNLRELEEILRRERAAIMCAEAVPWRCHRSLIADALTVRGVHVEHIMTLTKRQTHTLTPFVHAEGLELTYPAPAAALALE